MTRYTRLSIGVLTLTIATMSWMSPRAALAAGAAGIEEDAAAALKKLTATEPAAKLLSEKAKAILVFPSIVKAGFIVGAHYGEGVLFQVFLFRAHAGLPGLQPARPLQPADAVDEPTHRLHRGDGCPTAGDDRFHLPEQRQHRLVAIGVHEVGAELRVIGAAVASEHQQPGHEGGESHGSDSRARINFSVTAARSWSRSGRRLHVSTP